uniref:PAM2 domain-containing protein n=1 Tax=Gongylonema pulchrum TaxID=637853 RepID=A0A183EHM7_9BILA
LADPDCKKSSDELAAELFDWKANSGNSDIFLTKQITKLPTLSFGSNDEGCFVQHDGKSDPESQPLILIPIVPLESAREQEEVQSGKMVIEDEANQEIDKEADTQESSSVRRSKRVREKDDADQAVEAKKARNSGTAMPKVELPARSCQRKELVLLLQLQNQQNPLDQLNLLPSQLPVPLLPFLVDAPSAGGTA